MSDDIDALLDRGRWDLHPWMMVVSGFFSGVSIILGSVAVGTSRFQVLIPATMMLAVAILFYWMANDEGR